MMAPEPPADFVKRPLQFGGLKQRLLDLKGDVLAIPAPHKGAGRLWQDDSRQGAGA
jgi:hypothetical protein